jgi:hypothetical protein
MPVHSSPGHAALLSILDARTANGQIALARLRGMTGQNAGRGGHADEEWNLVIIEQSTSVQAMWLRVL